MKMLLMWIAAVVLWTSAAKADTYTITATTTTHPVPGLTRIQKHVQIGTNVLNQINVTEIRDVLGGPRGPILLAGPWGFGVEYYEITGHFDAYRGSYAGFLATAGYDVWVVDDRATKGVPDGGCTDGSFDCSIMSTWNTATEVQDIEFTRSLIVARWGEQIRPVVGGSVGGAIFALAAVNAFPAHYSGVLAWQGALFTNDVPTKTLNSGFCAFVTSLFNAGVIFDNSGVPIIALAKLAEAHPNDPAPPLLPGQPPGITNKQLFILVLSTHVVAPSLPTPTYVIATAKNADEFKYASIDRVFGYNPLFTNYLSVAQLKDLSCGISGDDTSTYNNLGAFTGKVYLQASDLSFAPMAQGTATLFTHADVTLRIDGGGRGELDDTSSKDVLLLAGVPQLLWLSTVNLHLH